MENYHRYHNESEDAYIYRVCAAKDIIGTWTDVANILNKELNRCLTESAYRKKYQMGLKYWMEKEDEVIDNSKYLKDIRREKDALQKERYKLHTEKLEYNRWRREEARDELYLEQLIKAIDENVSSLPSPVPIPTRRDKKCGILAFGDCHYGKDVVVKGLDGEVVNEYNPEIFKLRMSVLLGEVIDYIQSENLTNLKVVNLGDSLDGLLRMSQIWTLRTGVVDSAIEFADFMAKWLAELSKYAAVEYYSTLNGNHTELRLLDGLKGQHLNENTEKIINYVISIYNKENMNLEVMHNSTGFVYLDAAGYKVFGTHGDNIKDPQQALKDYKEVYGTDISYLIFGHLHHTSYNETGYQSGVIGIGSIMGIDDYSMKIKKSASASASLLTFEKNKGLVSTKQIILN